MPSKLMPGTPSMFAGSRMPCQWIEVWRPWIEFGGNRLLTRSSTVVPSRQRSVGAGTEPLTATPMRVRPVKFTGSSPMLRSKSVPVSTGAAALPKRGQPKAASAPPAASPCTKRRRETSPGNEEDMDILHTTAVRSGGAGSV